MPTTVKEAPRPMRREAPDTAAESDARAHVRAEAPVRGGVAIAESVVEKIAATAVRQVPGIYASGGRAGTDGIRARIRSNREVNLDMRMRVDYGEHIPTRGEQVRAVVASAVRELTDLQAREIKVKVTEIIVPDEQPLPSNQVSNAAE
jgi:uncharacterized alkaline shock family protein YloU